MSLRKPERNVLVAAAIALAFGLAWYVFVTTPLPQQWSLRHAWLLGLGGAVIGGALARAVSPSLAPVAGGAAMGIVLAAAVAQWRVSDVTISAWQAVWAGLTQMLAYQIAVWITVVASWLGVHVALLARRRTTAG